MFQKYNKKNPRNQNLETTVKKYALLFFINLFFISSMAITQVKLSAVADVELKKGFENSHSDLNGVPDDKLSFVLGRLHLFLTAGISKNITFNGFLTADNGSDLRVILKSASVSFNDLVASDQFGLNVEAGKILIPFGAYPANRWFSPQNPFTSFPLMYSYAVNISKAQGFYPGKNKDYNTFGNPVKKSGNMGLSVISKSTYDIGVKFYGNIVGQMVEYDIAVTNNPISTPEDFDVNPLPGFIGRIGVNPIQMIKTGLSFNFGNYMNTSKVSSKKVSSFNQLTLGFDLNFNYLFFDVNLEYAFNRWDVPKINDTTLVSSVFNKLNDKSKFTLGNQAIYFDTKIDLPFLAGLYTALRFEIMLFDKVSKSKFASKVKGLKSSGTWDDNISRIEFALGYKVSKGTIVKVDYQMNATSTDTFPIPFVSKDKSKDDVISLQLSTEFDIYTKMPKKKK